MKTLNEKPRFYMRDGHIRERKLEIMERTNSNETTINVCSEEISVVINLISSGNTGKMSKKEILEWLENKINE